MIELLSGALGLIWYALWTILVAESPEMDKKITKQELNYILDSLKETNQSSSKLQVPWKSILRSAPVWAIVVSHFSENWGFYTLLTQLPKYLKGFIYISSIFTVLSNPKTLQISITMN